MRQPYTAQQTNVTFRRLSTPPAQAMRYWVVRGGDLKGFGKIPVYSGTETEARAVARVLNKVNGL